MDDRLLRLSAASDHSDADVEVESDLSSNFLLKKRTDLADHLRADPATITSRTGTQFSRVDFLGLNFHRANFDEAVSALLATVGTSLFKYVVTPNVDHVLTVAGSLPRSDVRLAYDNADFMFCDSRVLSLMSKNSSIDLHAVPGSDVTAELLARLPDGKTISVVGGNATAHDRLRQLYPQFVWQFMAPPMGVRHSPAHQEAICDFIASAGSDVTFIAIGAPQSEIVCRRMKQRGDARGLCLCIGASLEFITGDKRRAPKWVQKAHGEWLFRLMCEPHRLAHRYLVKGPAIFLEWYRWSRTRAATSL